ncbi:MAG: ATP-binding protein [Actinobacteria bacterium]|nr:ATP-binding protein [Actinomycetota bacterium]
MRKDIIKNLITDFHEKGIPPVKPRLLEISVNSKKIIALTGVRRSGKTFQLYNVMNRLIKQKIKLKNILYFNFEDERIDENTFVLNNIIESYQELYPEINLGNCYFLFDEIQNIDGWEKFVRRIYEQISKNIFVTGSNSKMLSREISTSLRGRSMNYEIYPLNFEEYLNFLGIEINFNSTRSNSAIINTFEKFLSGGGFPELISVDSKIKDRVLQEYFNVMIFRDLIERYDITQTAILKYFCKRVIGNSSKEFSVNKIYNEIKSQGYKISKDTIYEFQNYVESIYLAFFIPKYSHSIVKQEFSKKKVYSIDNGLAASVDAFFIKNKGTALENLVFLELIKSGKKVVYYSNNFECDFLLMENEKVCEAIQVCFDINDSDTKNREEKGLINVCREFQLKRGLILTIYDEQKYTVNGITIEIIPVYKYILKKYMA